MLNFEAVLASLSHFLITMQCSIAKPWAVAFMMVTLTCTAHLNIVTDSAHPSVATVPMDNSLPVSSREQTHSKLVLYVKHVDLSFTLPIPITKT